jgi:hypothetical protein
LGRKKALIDPERLGKITENLEDKELNDLNF